MKLINLFYIQVVGILIQFILGVFILRLEFGLELFKFIGNEISKFMDLTDEACINPFTCLKYI